MQCRVRVYTSVRKWKQYIVEGQCHNHCRSIGVEKFKAEFPDYADKVVSSVTTMIPRDKEFSVVIKDNV